MLTLLSFSIKLNILKEYKHMGNPKKGQYRSDVKEIAASKI